MEKNDLFLLLSKRLAYRLGRSEDALLGQPRRVVVVRERARDKVRRVWRECDTIMGRVR
jgi:hypothetical protein